MALHAHLSPAPTSLRWAGRYLVTFSIIAEDGHRQRVYPDVVDEQVYSGAMTTIPAAGGGRSVLVADKAQARRLTAAVGASPWNF